MSFHKWFIPHRDTHQKAHLISWRALAVYIILFAVLQVIFSTLSITNPGILGTSSSITKERIIELTNMERGKLGLPALSKNPALDSAAISKAYNMFEEGYWAHFAPSGKTPWDFILGSGYKFSVAGENLAKNFSTPENVVAAWMASPSHKENIVNSKYRDIGIAIEDGVINGQRTTLVVQMFGTTSVLALKPQQVAQVKIPAPVTVPAEEYEKEREILILPEVAKAQTEETPIVSPFQVNKFLGTGIIVFLSILLLLDFIILRRRGIFRFSSSHFAHMAILGVAAATIISADPGQVGSGITFIYEISP